MIQENTFAAACYDMNTIEELEETLEFGFGTIDMKIWNLSESEWTEQIQIAITELKADCFDR